MSRISDLLARKRQAAISEMQTGSPVDTTEIDDAIAAIEPPATASETPRSARLRLTRHARKRMSQRGVSVSDVYAIYMGGECRNSGADLAFAVTDAAIRDAPSSLRPNLTRLRGAAIIVGPRDDGSDHVLVTVLRDGDDTRFVGRKR